MFSRAISTAKSATAPIRKTPEQLLIWSIYNNNNELLRRLIYEDNVNPNARKNKAGNPAVMVRKPALIVAIEINNMEAVNILLNAPGIDVNLPQGSNYRTALMAASIDDSNMSLLNELIKMGANVNFTDDQGNSAIFYAAQSFSINNINFLLSRGANINLVNKQGLNPLTYILTLNNGKLGSQGVNENYLDTIQFLLQHGANKSNAMNIDERPEVVEMLTNGVEGRSPLNLLPIPRIEAKSVSDIPTVSDYIPLNPTVAENAIRHFRIPRASASTKQPPMATASVLSDEEEKINGGKSRRNKKYKNKSKKGKKKNKSIRRKNKSIRRKK